MFELLMAIGFLGAGLAHLLPEKKQTKPSLEKSSRIARSHVRRRKPNSGKSLNPKQLSNGCPLHFKKGLHMKKLAKRWC